MKKPKEVVVSFFFSTRSNWPTINTSNEEAKKVLEIPDSLLGLPLDSVEHHFARGHTNTVTATFYSK